MTAATPPRTAPPRPAIRVTTTALAYATASEALIDALDGARGCLFASQIDAPGRYARRDFGFVDPPLVVMGVGGALIVSALNARGRLLLPAVAAALAGEEGLREVAAERETVTARVAPAPPALGEEARLRAPSLLSAVRALVAMFAGDDPHLGLYGAFGYDLAHRLEPVPRRLERAADQRDLLLYLPDRLLIVDHARETAERRDYEFAVGDAATDGLPCETPPAPWTVSAHAAHDDHAPGAYPATVERARAAARLGELFEVVPGQVFARPCVDAPSAIYRRLRAANPAPYAALLNLGDGEYLVSASPEMFVRVTGRRVETCPISGTIARGRDAIEDAEQVRRLLNSAKDEAELSMCTDVDRNDKARVCEPGSVRLLARRHIETYSRLFHTIDHVEGKLASGRDALDALAAHMWAVTVTGAPKLAAMAFIEANERSPRRWYGGAIGGVLMNGDMNTGLTLRTVRLKDGLAEVRAGATLLYESDPAAEDEECRLKAAALLAAIGGAAPRAAPVAAAAATSRPHVLLIDFDDSFVHTLGDYLRQAGAEVETWRHGLALARLGERAPDLAVLSPGPGRPADFGMGAIIAAALAARTPLFGVCLGLQGIAEHFGAALNVADRPAHGIASEIDLTPGRWLRGAEGALSVGRYHSLHVTLPAAPLEALAHTADGTVMALEHPALPIAAVQFHPESILSASGGAGLALVAGTLAALTGGG